MPATRSKELKDTNDPPLLPPASEPAKRGRGQSKKVVEQHEESHPPSNRPLATGKRNKGGKGSKKATADTMNPEAACNDIPAVADEPAKRGRKRAATSEGQDGAAPQAKKLKDSGVDANQLPHLQKAAPARKKTDTVPRDPLPNRTGRNVHPAGQPTKRRTSKEVATAREAERKAIEDKIREGEMAKRRLAEWQVAEDEMDDEDPQRLSAVTRKRTCNEIEDTSDVGEAFDFTDVDAIPDSEPETEDEAPAPKAKASRKPAKPAKGALRQEVQDMVKGMMGGGGGSRKKSKTATFDSNLKLPPLDTAPKKYQNSGLRVDTKSKNSEVTDPFESGGLNDEDIHSDRPPFFQSRSQAAVPKRYPENLQRNPSRKNELVQVVEGSAQQAPTAKAPNSKRTKAQAQVKGKPKAPPAPPAAPVPAPNSGTGNTADGSQFLHDARWKKVFNPTLTHALYTSREPFLHFANESPQFLAIVQRVFNISFPDVTFSLTSDDPVAYDRIKSRKSKLADTVLKFVKNFFEQPEFYSKPNDIREYVCWALKDGPAYYALPTPRDCRAKRGEKGYIAPDGFLESEFIAPVAHKYLQYAANSALQPPLDGKHPPKGLYMMILLLVERAFSAHLSGQYVAPPHFTHDNCWQALEIFSRHVDNVSERRWDRVLTPHRDPVDAEVDKDVRADQSMISAYRAQIYVPTSPVKV